MHPDFKKRFQLTALLCVTVIICAAQQEKENGLIRFHSINQVGFLDGLPASSWQLQSVNGIQYKSWFGGIGAGLDYYRFRGIPVFADIRKSFGHTKNKLFIYGDGGIHFVRATNSEKTPFGIADHFSNGVYLDAGMGYQIRINRKNAFLISLGYSYKTAKETTTRYLFPPTYVMIGSPYPETNRYNYHLNRISLKVGWAIN